MAIARNTATAFADIFSTLIFRVFHIDLCSSRKLSTSSHRWRSRIGYLCIVHTTCFNASNTNPSSVSFTLSAGSMRSVHLSNSRITIRPGATGSTCRPSLVPAHSNTVCAVTLTRWLTVLALATRFDTSATHSAVSATRSALAIYFVKAAPVSTAPWAVSPSTFVSFPICPRNVVRLSLHLSFTASVDIQNGLVPALLVTNPPKPFWVPPSQMMVYDWLLL